MWVISEAACEAGLGKSIWDCWEEQWRGLVVGLTQRLAVLLTASGRALGRHLFRGRKNTTVVSDGESWEGMLQIEALQKPVGQPDILCKVFQGLQRVLHQAKARLRGRQNHFISMYPTVKGSAGVLQTHKWLLAGVKQAVPKCQWLGEAVLALPLPFWQPPDDSSLFSILPLMVPLLEYLGCIGQEGETEWWGIGREEGVGAEME